MGWRHTVCVFLFSVVIFMLPGVLCAAVFGIRIPFIEQAGDGAFFAPIPGGTVSVSCRGITYTLSSREGRCTFRETFLGSGFLRPEGEGRPIIRVSLFFGKDPKVWKSSLPAYESVIFGELYRGIKLRLVAKGKGVEKVFIVDPGVNPGVIRIKVSGVRSLSVCGGRLKVETPLGSVFFSKPVAYQIVGGSKRYVDVSYRLMGDTYGFEIGSYDRKKPLFIDPFVSVLFGGRENNDAAYASCVDPDTGNVYVGGLITYGFPLCAGGSYDENGFVAVFTPDLSRPLAFVCFGGSGGEWVSDLVVSGNYLYAAGSTDSEDFPVTQNAYSEHYNGGNRDGFIVKFTKNLSSIVSATYFGGGLENPLYLSQGDRITSMAVGSDGSIYVAGMTTDSEDFPVTSGAFDTTFNGGGFWGDGFVARLNPNLSELIASTFIGGSASDTIYGLALGSDGSVYVVGDTGGGMPISGGAMDYKDGLDAFVIRLNSDLSQILSSTYLGGGGDDTAFDVAVDESGVYVVGKTLSGDFPATPEAISRTCGPCQWGIGDSAFVTRFNLDLSQILASTFLGNVGENIAYSVTLDGKEHAYVAGAAGSFFQVTDGSYDTSYSNAGDGFVSKLSIDMKNLISSTYVGGSGKEVIYSISITQGFVYVAGYSSSSDFPVNAWSAVSGSGSRNAFLGRFDPDLSAAPEGDVDGNGIVNIVDALLTSRHILGLFSPGFCEERANLDSSGSVGFGDALSMARMPLGIGD